MKFNIKGPVIAAGIVVLFISLSLGSSLYKNVGNQALVVGAPSLATGWQPPTSGASWYFLYSPGMPATPSTVQPVVGADGNTIPMHWYFNFPQYPGPFPCSNDMACPGVHYLVTNTPGAISGKSITVTGHIEITGAPVFHYQTEPGNTCISPTSYAHLFIQRAGDNLASEYYRWWSNPVAISIGPGRSDFSVTVPMLPYSWSDVYGKQGNSSPGAVAGFNAALANSARIGMTFGGGCFFGHGINITGGTARFVTDSYVINR